jgi:asparagine synthase (glutamine-hydrolysing)
MGTYIRCEPFEVATGWTYGLLPDVPMPPEVVAPRQALDDVLRPALESGPCFVTFSGGRDSSAVLAAATDLARREGHAEPIPVTRVYPDIPETDEADWQRTVVDHLRLTNWVRLNFRAGESDLLGDAAKAGLRRRGLLWPPALHAHDVVFQEVGPGSLITGEGGDAVLGMQRVTPLVLFRRRRSLRRVLLPHAVGAVMPGPVRRMAATRAARNSVQSRWLRPAALARHARLAAADATVEPLRFDRAKWMITRRRSFATIRHNHAEAAREFGLVASDPLLDPRFVAAIAQWAGRWGFDGRTAAMHALFSDILPEPVLTRSTKAAFNHAHAGDETRRFASTWDGSGVDTDLVDPERLRQVWLSAEPTMAAGLLLQSAWLSHQEANQ